MEAQESPARAQRSTPGLALSIRETIAARLPGYLTLAKFALVGVGGYLIYQATLFLTYDLPLLGFLPAKGAGFSLGALHHSDGRLLITSLVAAELSIIGVYLGHSRWTFQNREVAYRPNLLRFLQFNLKALISSVGIVTVLVNVLVLRFDFAHFAAVPLSVLAAFTWNWLWDAQYIWRRRT